MKRFSTIFLFFIQFALYPKSLAEYSEYPQFCQLAAKDNTVYSEFKRNPTYNQTLEHLSREQGILFLNMIQSDYPHLLPYFDRFRQNDRIGHPNTYEYGPAGSFSPTTLRYIKIAGDLQKLFGDMSCLRIVEIGGGYGGQCKIISDLSGFASYTMLDLAECNPLTMKYLRDLGVMNVASIDRDQLDQAGEYDLVISNYAFSEIERDEQAQYLEKIIGRTPRGYMTLNFFPSLNAFSLSELLEFLKSKGIQGFVEEENPSTADGHNRLLIWDESK